MVDLSQSIYPVQPQQGQNSILIGNLREAFALQQFSSNHEVFLHEKADFQVDNKFVIEIRGKNKDKRQISDFDKSFVFMDDIEIGP